MANPKDSTTDGPDFASRLPVIGPYKAVRILGEGAMGVVYLAKQTRPFRREVALKLIRPGLGSKQVVARFERERQALALMNHPHVARVYDAGETEDRRPYFVMEHVDGVPVTKYCDTHKLSNTERLHLFLKIGEAVQHAHQKGIIHRDIKPSNILVSPGAAEGDQPVPKVIDFGVAKAIGPQLTGDSFATQFGQFVGTPAYMSPEQANPMFEDVDIRSDVYSLGVLLYELISGVLPFDFTRALEKGSIGEVQRVILEEEPSLPSTRFSSLGEDASTIAEKHGTDVYHLRRELTDDLDSIVMQALEKDRARRYATVLDFTRDVERHLRSEPVLARKQTFVYRARKFIRRRRKHLAVAALAAALLSASTLGLLAVRSARVARLQSAKDAAAVEYLEARSVVYSNPSVAADRLYAIVSRHPENIEARNDLAYLLYREYRIDEAIKEAQAAIAQGGAVGPAHLLLAQIYQRRDPELAQRHALEGKRLSPDDRFHQAMALPPEDSAEAVEILTRVIQSDRVNFDARWHRAWRYFELRDYEQMLGDAEKLTDYLGGTGWNLHGVALERLGRHEEAEESFTRALNLSPDNAAVYLNRADVRRKMGRYQEALIDCNKAIKCEPDFVDGYAHRGLIRLELGHAAAAEADCQRTLGKQPTSILGLLCRARVRIEQSRRDLALLDLDKALELAPNNSDLLYQRAEQLRITDRYEVAIADYTRCIQLASPHTEACYSGRGRARMRLNQFDAALEDFDDAIALKPTGAHYRNRARVLRFMGRYNQAISDYEAALSLDPANPEIYAARAICRWLASDLVGAAADLERGLSLNPPRAEDRVHAYLRLWNVNASMGKRELAETQLQKASAEGSPNSWEATLVAYVRGLLTIEEILALSDSNARKCEAYYYVGAKAAVEQNRIEAIHWFRQCVALRYSDYSEYDLAMGMLRALEAASKPGESM